MYSMGQAPCFCNLLSTPVSITPTTCPLTPPSALSLRPVCVPELFGEKRSRYGLTDILRNAYLSVCFSLWISQALPFSAALLFSTSVSLSLPIYCFERFDALCWPSLPHTLPTHLRRGNSACLDLLVILLLGLSLSICPHQSLVWF